MFRGTLVAALVVAATAVSAPAPAAPASTPVHQVWEIQRVRSGGPSTVTVDLLAFGDGRPTVLAFADLAPSGKGYRAETLYLGVFGHKDTRWRTYGLPSTVPQPPCPDDSLCGEAACADCYVLKRFTFKPKAGHRYLVAGPKDATYLYPWTSRWMGRKTSLGLRVALAENADAHGVTYADGTVEAFRAATVKGGAYGSEVFAEVPCDAGIWTLDDGADVSYGPFACDGSADPWAFGLTHAARTWRLAGPTSGRSLLPFRLIVLDHPKR